MASAERLCNLIDDLLSILRTGEQVVLWSRYRGVDEVINDLERFRERIDDGDSTAREQFTLLCAPTGSIEEIAISSGWVETWVELVHVKYRSEFT